MALPAFSLAQTDSELPTVNVISDRTGEQQEFDTVNTSRIGAQDITEQQVRNIKDMVRYEPGVSVSNKPSRFGLSGFNIRGLEDNRILMQVDGVRMPDSFVFGGYSNASRDMVDIELLQAVEIQRGTGSAKSGSDALGGVVAYATPRPEDILDGRQWGATFKSVYQSVDKSTVVVGTAALGNDIAKLLVRGVRRAGQESETHGEDDIIGLKRTVANPQQQDSNASLIKLALAPHADYRIELGYQNSDRNIDTHLLSRLDPAPGKSKDMNTWDRYRFEQWSLDQRLSGLPLGTIDLKFYQQKSSTWQYTAQERRPANPFDDALYQRYFDFRQKIHGLKLDIATHLDGLGKHLLNWGADWSLTKTEQMRDGYTTYADGFVERKVTVDTFPTRDTPLAETRRWALYAQDEWLLADALTLIAGGRYENYRLTPKPDAIYLANSAEPASGAEFRNFSPKLGAIWRIGNGYAIAGQYAYGFRAPPYDDVNIGFANAAAGYTAVANPGLREETSRGLELSLRHSDDAGNWSVTAFDNRYTDFIERVQLDCPGDPACSPTYPLTYQSQNLPAVRIYGLEARFYREFLPGWIARGGLAYAHGRNLESDEPIYSVNPASGTLGLIHRRGQFRYEVSTTFAAGKKAEDAAGSNRQFLPDGYAVVDLRATWNFARNSLLAIGVNNVFDRLYYQWADVPVADLHDPDSQFGQQRYSQAGRNFAVTFQAAF
ncbi:MAG: TonB-dependent hemoglobin/transferrin/lactoferrin family receptor [Rhodocyclaceae bacterium]|nr:TonB-dependent hemoglobin/transferrin/lactoferrin family receptor [Rhodocyclaceae bacterium]